MAVFRVEKTKDYTVMNNHHLKNRQLSLKAKGLLSMMLSLPDSWDYSTRGLAAICKEGVDSIGGALKELENAGYIVRNRLRDDRGRIPDTEYVIYETPEHVPHTKSTDLSPCTEYPDTKYPDTENPYMDNPDTVQPDTENPAQLNTNRLKTYKAKIKKSNTHAANPYPSYPDPSSSLISVGSEADRMRAKVKLNIDYDCIATSSNRERLDEIVEIMVETLCANRENLRVSGVEYPAALVKKRLLQINSLHIEYIFACLEKSAHPIRNIKQYLLATLFNAPVTKSNYYDELVRQNQQVRDDWIDGLEDLIE